jgi:hypothetical protein
MTDRKLKVVVVLLAGIAGSTLAQAQTPVALIHDAGVGPISFATGDLKAALVQNGYSVTDLPLGDPSGAAQPVRVILTTQAVGVPGKPTIAGITNQGYAIQRAVDGSATNWWVIGQDAPGAMYGGFELAEAVKLAGGLAGVINRQANPYLANRGIKFNIPLDARTPTYTEKTSPARMTSYHSNVPEMWSLDFWSRYLDQMARHRYNTLSLWSESPFPSLVRVPEYPNTALANIQGRVYDPTNSTWSTVTHKTMTMDEKISFWRQVMQHARDRGIDVYVFTWNIFVKGTENSRYGLTTSPANATTKDWVRRATRTLFDTYPLLAGIGVTAGENMGGLSNAEKEQWCWDTFGLGVQDAVANAQNPASPYYSPNRVIRLIHRAHQTSLTDITALFQNLPGYTNADSTLAFSFKYSQAHMHSSSKPQFIYQNNWFNSIPAGKKTWLTVRNDDLYYLRWGDPDFARSYLTNLPDLSKLAGFYMGPDGNCWGREFVSTEPESPRQQVMDKMWYSFLLWGRLSYDPTLPNSQFQAILGDYFPQVSGVNLTNLYAGWASVSKIFPLLTRFYWGSLDFEWYPEACWSSSGFETVQNFITPRWDPMQSGEDGDRPLPMSIKQYVNGDAASDRLNPEQVADLLQQYADNGLNSIQALSPGTNKELRLTLGDIRAMAHLGRYYAEKIRGATDLLRYQVAGLANNYTDARTHLLTASNHWSQYAAQWSTQYVGQVLIRQGNGLVDIAAIQTNVNADIPPPIAPPTTNAAVLFVVGDATALNASDRVISNQLRGVGYTIQVLSATSASSIDAAGKKLVLISATVSAANVTTKFRDGAVPVINWETALQDDFGYASSSGNGGSQTNLNITNAGHPLAAGFPAGVRTVATAAGDFSWGEPGGSPIIIARLNDGSHPCLYAYEAGATMNSGTAPARRVHLFLQNNTFASLNVDGLRLFDAAVRWAAPVRFQPPVLQGRQLRLEWVGGGTLQTATNLPGAWSDVPGGTSPFLAAPTNAAQFFRLKQ